jgi:hypothetical protein
VPGTRTWLRWRREQASFFADYSDEELAFLRDFLVGGREFIARHLERIKKS